MNQVDVNEEPSNNAVSQVLNLQQMRKDDHEMLNTSVAPENGQAPTTGHDDEPFSQLSFAKKEAGNEEFQSIAHNSGLRIITPDEDIPQIQSEDIRRVDTDTDASESSNHGVKDRLRARHLRDVLARLPEDGIFHLKNGISELAGADLRGADLSRFREGIGYRIEVPLKGGESGKTEILALSDWLKRATTDDIKALVPGMVFQSVKSDEFEVTNFGGKHNDDIINKLSNKKISKAYDYSDIDINKDFSGHQRIDPDEPFYEDKWAANPDKVELLTPNEYRHKMAIQARCILGDVKEMDKYVKEKMDDAAAVNDAMGQMIEELVKHGKINPAFARMGEESEGAHRERLRQKVFDEDEKRNNRLEAFFRRSYIADQAKMQEIKDSVNPLYASFESSEARAEFLRGEVGRLPKHELGKLGSPDLSKFEEELLKGRPRETKQEAAEEQSGNGQAEG